MANNKELIDVLGKLVREEENKKCSKGIWKWILAGIGVLAAIGGVAYAVYRFVNRDYLDEFDDDLSEDYDYDDEFFEDEDDVVSEDAKKESVEEPAAKDTETAESDETEEAFEEIEE